VAKLSYGLMFMAACQLGRYELRDLLRWAESDEDVDVLAHMIYSTDDVEYYVTMGKAILRENGLGNPH
jgi:hypothetical protein